MGHQPGYLALQRLAALGGQASRDAYENDLAGWLDLDAQAARALAALDRDDVATTIRTLNEITWRARGIPARRTTTEGNSDLALA